MYENENKNGDNKSCLNSISFTMISILLFIFELISLIMSILCLVMINWSFLKNFIKVLNIISLVIIVLIIIINFFIFIKIKNVKHNIVKNYRKRMCLTFLLLLVYFIIIIFHIYNAIYLSKKLHIINDPVYEGRRRVLDNEPKKYDDIPLGQFIIAGFCPAIISVLNLLCIIFCVLFRKKMIITYRIMRLSDDENKDKDIVMHKHKSRHKQSPRKVRRFSSELVPSQNNMSESAKSKSRRNSVTMRANTFDEGARTPKRQSSKSRVNNQINTLDTKESFINELGENKGYKYKKSKFHNTRVSRLSKQYINEINNEDENDNKNNNNNNNNVILKLF